MYKILGTIRDLQLQQQRIDLIAKQDPGIAGPYHSLLEEEIKKLKPELAEISSAKMITESKRKTGTSIPDEFQLPGLKSFMQKKWAAVKAIILSGDFSDDNIHSIRKNLKDIFYNIKEYESAEYDTSSLQVWKGRDENYFNEFLDELGNFQDKCTSIDLMRSYWLTGVDQHSREMLEGLKKIWMKEKISLKHLLVKRFKTEIVQK